MREHEQDLNQKSPEIERIAQLARRPVTMDSGARERMFAALSAEPLPRPGRFASPLDGLDGRSWSIAPLRAAALAAGLVGISLFTGYQSGVRRADLTIGVHSVQAPSMPTPPASSDSAARMQVFVLNAPDAKQVSVVGDFNEWSATPMARSERGGVWTVAVPLSAGRHTYSFVVNAGGTDKWQPDPTAPLAPDDGFGNANSVVLVPGAHP